LLLSKTHQHPTERRNQFGCCPELAKVDIVGGGEIHKTICNLSLDRWRNEMNQEINRINQHLPTTHTNIQELIHSVLRRIVHYKTEHHNLLKGATTLLELAI
jgi:hypothetical protein